jgi:hypothetical protein
MDWQFPYMTGDSQDIGLWNWKIRHLEGEGRRSRAKGQLKGTKNTKEKYETST